MHLFKPDMITVLGPTASGKTAFAARLAFLLDTDIISADSRQVYKGMDIGTGKDLSEFIVDGKHIKYHLIDIVNAGEKYNVYQYQTDFLKVYKEIKLQNKTPILCGGTGLYIQSVLDGYKLINVPVNNLLRAQLTNLTLPELNSILQKIKNTHNKSDSDTIPRAIRAIEIAEYYKNMPETENNFPKINTLIFGIHFNREVLKQRIAIRLKQRLRDGMIDEAKRLIDSNVDIETLIYYGLEYKYLALFLLKQISYNKMVEQLATAINQFSKRQSTWFRKMEREGYKIIWIDGDLPLNKKIEYAFNIINT